MGSGGGIREWQIYKLRGNNDIINSAGKPEIPIAVHHSSVSSDIKIFLYHGSSFLWTVLGITDDIWGLVWSEQRRVVKLFIVLTPQFLSHDQGWLTKELQQHVKSVTLPCEYLRKVSERRQMGSGALEQSVTSPCKYMRKVSECRQMGPGALEQFPVLGCPTSHSMAMLGEASAVTVLAFSSISLSDSSAHLMTQRSQGCSMRLQVPTSALLECEARDRVSSVGGSGQPGLVTLLAYQTIPNLPPLLDPLPLCLPVLLMLQWLPQHPGLGPMPLKMDLPQETYEPYRGHSAVPRSVQTLIPVQDIEALPLGSPSSAVNDDLLLLPSSLPLVSEDLPRHEFWKERCPWGVTIRRLCKFPSLHFPPSPLLMAIDCQNPSFTGPIGSNNDGSTDLQQTAWRSNRHSQEVMLSIGVPTVWK
ncbi:PREDICTED: uncharacterized protein LOC105586873 [Cercocebus atys]|uniref:uncharacterized protein LOC105586873 n=1 Tax=Cercocebus atys TaxID=9531 RepID=UPI0005F42C9A|nr:PREDICTED: uncharacterized protein LOC105586873 [Cercocebus atys]